MKELNRFIYMLALVLWIINTVIAAVFCVLGSPVSPVLVLIPSLFCCYHYAELNWFIYHEGSGKK